MKVILSKITDTIYTQKLLEKNNRIDYLDIARGIAIILMIIGHVIGQGSKRNFIFSFHMPLFIIISGMFFKEKDVKSFVINTFKGLIFPYIVTIFFVDLFKYFIFCEEHDILLFISDYIKQIVFSYSYLKFNTNVHGLGVLWFIPFLALVRIMFYMLKKFSKNNDIELAFGIILIAYLGYILGQKGYWLPFSLDVAMVSLIFYYIGYILKKYNLLHQIITDNRIILILLIIWILGIKYGCIELAIRKYSNGLFCFISAIAGSICIIRISKFIENKIKILANILKWYGRNSMYILLFHCIESSLIDYYSFISIRNKTEIKISHSVVKICIITIFTYIYTYLKNLIKKYKKVSIK